MNDSHHTADRMRSSSHGRPGQTVIEYAILIGVLVLVSYVGVVLLYARLQSLTWFAIHVTPQSRVNDNPAINVQPLTPIVNNGDGLVPAGPGNLSDGSGISDLREQVLEVESPGGP